MTEQRGTSMDTEEAMDNHLAHKFIERRPISPGMREARKQLHRANEEYEAKLVQLFCNAYRDAVGVWPNRRLEEALADAVRCNT